MYKAICKEESQARPGIFREQKRLFDTYDAAREWLYDWFGDITEQYQSLGHNGALVVSAVRRSNGQRVHGVVRQVVRSSDVQETLMIPSSIRVTIEFIAYLYYPDGGAVAYYVVTPAENVDRESNTFVDPHKVGHGATHIDALRNLLDRIEDSY